MLTKNKKIIKKINFFIVSLTLFLMFSCGSSDSEQKTENKPQLIVVEGIIVGEGEMGYLGKNGMGNIVPLLKTTLELYTESDFEGKIMFENDCDDPLAKGIFYCDDEYSRFESNSIFKRVKLHLEKADSNFVNGYFVRKIEFLKSPKVKISNFSEIEIENSASLKILGNEIHPNDESINVTHFNKIKDSYYAFSTFGYGRNIQGIGYGCQLYGTGEFDNRGMMKLNGDNWEESSFPVRGNVYFSFPFKNQHLILGRYKSIGGKEINSLGQFDGLNFSALGDKYTFGTMDYASVNTCINYQNKLYVAGFFSNFSSGITMWDGEKWSVVGKGSKDDSKNRICNGLCSGAVLDLKVYKGKLYAAGTFQFADGKRVNGIAKWDGKKWMHAGLGVIGQVNSLEIFNDKLYVAGVFNNVGGTKANSLATYDGEDWTVLNLNIKPNSKEEVNITSLKVIGNRIYIGGDFKIESEDYSIYNILSFDTEKVYSVGSASILEGKKIYGLNGIIEGFYSDNSLSIVYGKLKEVGKNRTFHIFKLPL